jgi:RNA polymerase sigma-70 factor (ECF subfamily)
MLEHLRSDATARDEAWESVYSRYFAEIHRLVWRCGVPSAEVDDLTQRVFVIAYERIDEVAELTTVGGWLRGIALRVVASHRRWRRVRHVKQWLVHAEAPRPSAEIAPDVHAGSIRAAARVQEVLDRLKPKLRDALVLCDVEGLSPAEAGRVMRVPLNTVRSRRRLAREEFGRLWRQRYGGEHE